MACGVRTKRDLNDPLQSALSIDATLTDNEGDPFTLADIIEDPAAEAAIQRVEEWDRVQRLHDALENALATLPQEQADALRMKYFECLPADAKTCQKGLRALRHPSISRGLKQFDAMPDAYMVNYNQEAEEVNQEDGVAIPHLLAAAGIALLRPTVKKKKDIAWNRKQFSAAVTSNVLQNRPLTGNNSVCVASLKFTVKRNADTARTNARTFMTFAETKGRQAVYNAADALGIHRVKIWRTVHDNRVRDAHAAMDGVSVPWTEDFIVDGHKMIGPGDRSAPAYLWYNCRCRIKSEKARV